MLFKTGAPCHALEDANETFMHSIVLATLPSHLIKIFLYHYPTLVPKTTVFHAPFGLLTV